MNGRMVAGLIVVPSLIVGAIIYWLQEYGYYYRLPADAPFAQIRLVPLTGGEPEPIPVADLQAIDADSSPLRFRACFTVENSLAMLTETYELAEKPVPLNGPRWFTCYDARAIGRALETGEALAFLSEPQIHTDVQRIVAVFADGRAYAWQQLAPGATD